MVCKQKDLLKMDDKDILEIWEPEPWVPSGCVTPRYYWQEKKKATGRNLC